MEVETALAELHGLGFTFAFAGLEPFGVRGNVAVGISDQRAGGHAAGAGTNEPVTRPDAAIREVGFLEQPLHLFEFLIEGLQLEQLLDDWIRPELLQRPVFGVFDLLTKVLGQGLFELQRIAVVLEIEGLVQFSRQCLAFSGGSLLGGNGSGNVYGKASDLAIGAGADH